MTTTARIISGFLPGRLRSSSPSSSVYQWLSSGGVLCSPFRLSFSSRMSSARGARPSPPGLGVADTGIIVDAGGVGG
ncbi:hypothetical protein [Sodalis glossinidius]|uniref:hypothetical protein n=1 Tax=Sodalis glossinidius TaxID=63612 RepID=UPI0011D14497